MDSLGYDIFKSVETSKDVSIFCVIIQREAPRCSFYLDGHMPEPRTIERATDNRLSRFFYINFSDCESSDFNLISQSMS